MRRASFDYANTCPKIDREIADAKDVVFTYLFDMLQEACPLLSAESLDKYAGQYAEDLYRKLESVFETVRETNEDMRREAERQIEQLQDALSTAEAEVERLEREAV